MKFIGKLFGIYSLSLFWIGTIKLCISCVIFIYFAHVYYVQLCARAYTHKTTGLILLPVHVVQSTSTRLLSMMVSSATSQWKPL